MGRMIDRATGTARGRASPSMQLPSRRRVYFAFLLALSLSRCKGRAFIQSLASSPYDPPQEEGAIQKSNPAPLPQAAAACWGSRQRCEHAAVAGGGRWWQRRGEKVALYFL